MIVLTIICQSAVFACTADKHNNGEQRQGCKGLRYSVLQIEARPARYDTTTDDLRSLGPRIRSEWTTLLATVSQFYCIAYPATTTLNYVLCGQTSRPVSWPTTIIYANNAPFGAFKVANENHFRVSVCYDRVTVGDNCQAEETNRSYSCSRTFLKWDIWAVYFKNGTSHLAIR